MKTRIYATPAVKGLKATNHNCVNHGCQYSLSFNCWWHSARDAECLLLWPLEVSHLHHKATGLTFGGSPTRHKVDGVVSLCLRLKTRLCGSTSQIHLHPWSPVFVYRTHTLYLNAGSNFAMNERCWPSVGLMLVQRLRRWTNISPTLVRCFVFAAKSNQNVVPGLFYYCK